MNTKYIRMTLREYQMNDEIVRPSSLVILIPSYSCCFLQKILPVVEDLPRPHSLVTDGDPQRFSVPEWLSGALRVWHRLDLQSEVSH